MSKLAYDMSPAEQQTVMALHKQKYGMNFGGPVVFMRPEWKENDHLAMDAQPQLVTTPNSGIPAYLTFYMDADVLKILTAKNQAAEIFGEKQKGTWTDSTLLFPVVEQTYEVSTYGDRNNNGSSGINTNFPERQTYLFQTTMQYGDLEVERAGLGKINFVAEQRAAAMMGLAKFSNLAYFYGINGQQTYGILNEPGLQPAIAPSPKANGGLAWLNGTAPNATANEVLADIQSLYTQAINQSAGNIDLKSKCYLIMSPSRTMAMTFTNSFGVNVSDLLKKNFPQMEVMSAVQYGAITAQNPQGFAGGELVQLWFPDVMGQESGYCSYNSKMMASRIIPEMNSFKQKLSQGTSGFILRQDFAMAQLLGV
jgi:hypothetical protein